MVKTVTGLTAPKQNFWSNLGGEDNITVTVRWRRIDKLTAAVLKRGKDDNKVVVEVVEEEVVEWWTRKDDNKIVAASVKELEINTALQGPVVRRPISA